MPTSNHQLWIILAFAVLGVVGFTVTRLFATRDSVWAAALPWVLLALFWIALFVVSRRDRRGRAE